MREFWIIFKQAFTSKAKSKSFIITTIIMIAGIFLLANISKIIDTVQNVTGTGNSQQVLQVVDESGIIFDRLQAQLEAGEYDITVEAVNESEEVLTDKVSSGEIDSIPGSFCR